MTAVLQGEQVMVEAILALCQQVQLERQLQVIQIILEATEAGEEPQRTRSRTGDSGHKRELGSITIMALDYGPCLSDLRGIRILRVIEAIWQQGPALLVFLVFGIMVFCAVEQAIGAAIVIFYGLLYFIIFATRRPLVKAVIITLMLTSALQAFREQYKAGWHPNAVTSAHQVSK